MTQSEFDAELASGKQSWPGSHVSGDLDISDRVIHGDISLSGMFIEGDLILSGTVIIGSLELVGVCVGGNLDLNGLRVRGTFHTRHPGIFVGVEGEIICDDLVVNGHSRTLPSKRIRTSAKE